MASSSSPVGSPRTPVPPLPTVGADGSADNTWTLRRGVKVIYDMIPPGIKIPETLDLKDAGTVKKIHDNAFHILIGLGTLYCLMSNYKLAVFSGVALLGAIKLKPEEVYQKPIGLIQTYLPFGDQKGGILSLFVNLDEKADDNKKFQASRNLFLAVLIANLFIPWLVQNGGALFFGYKAAEWIHGVSKTNKGASDAAATPSPPIDFDMVEEE